jgi:hypothetical protein
MDGFPQGSKAQDDIIITIIAHLGFYEGGFHIVTILKPRRYEGNIPLD